jgi:hypothetical protein
VEDCPVYHCRVLLHLSHQGRKLVHRLQEGIGRRDGEEVEAPVSWCKPASFLADRASKRDD